MRNHYNTILKHDVGGSADMHYVAMRFPRYEEQILGNKLYLLPCYGLKDNVLEKPSTSGQRILTSLYRLYGEINKKKQKTPYTELIKTWCSKNMHPYPPDLCQGNTRGDCATKDHQILTA